MKSLTYHIPHTTNDDSLYLLYIIMCDVVRKPSTFISVYIAGEVYMTSLNTLQKHLLTLIWYLNGITQVIWCVWKFCIPFSAQKISMIDLTVNSSRFTHSLITIQLLQLKIVFNYYTSFTMAKISHKLETHIGQSTQCVLPAVLFLK